MAIHGHQVSEIKSKVATQFYNDIIRGLTTTPKFLQSKYFYDEIGDKLFQRIMHTPEYYPTRCELEIFTQKVEQMCDMLISTGEDYDIIELGAGDATKSMSLLECMVNNELNFTYYPIDISGNIIDQLHERLPAQVPGLQVVGLRGDYFNMLQQAYELSHRKKLILFLGSNIGNFTIPDAKSFLLKIREQMSPGDMILIGFDLKKDPKTILNAYNDSGGITKAFNMNLLRRINKELDADFEIEQFDHYPTYDPVSGSCKSYLISLKKQVVTICNTQINFEKGEPIHMEISQKYSIAEIEEISHTDEWEHVAYFFDSRKWFVDVVWRCE